jgi:RNA polymerase sigma-70 factor (ECF subfamily)
VTVDQRGLVERAQQGDHDAFVSLIDLSLARLDAAAWLILRDAELARDAVQDAMVRAWRDLPGLRDPERFGPWLHRLTVNACLDLARRRRRRVIEVELTPIDQPSVPDAASQVADRDLLDHALARLEPEQRAVVVLRFFLGLSLPETAAALGIPVGTVKSRLHRSLAHMRISVTSEDDVAPTAAAEGRHA